MDEYLPSRTLFAVVILWVLAGCASAPAPPANGVDVALTGGLTEPEDIIQAAAKRQASGDLQGALMLYVEVTKVAEQSGVWFEIARLQSRLGFSTKALAGYERAVQLDPTNAKAYEGAGLIYLDSDATDQAAYMLSQAVELDGTLWRAHNGLGVVADLEKRHDDAIEHYVSGLAVHPTSPMLYGNLGYSRYLAGDLKGAESDFLEALSLDRNYITAWKNLSLVYARQGRYEDAFKILQTTSDKSRAYNDVGYIAMLNEDLEIAENFFDEAIRLSPRYYPSAVENREIVRDRMREAGQQPQPR